MFGKVIGYGPKTRRLVLQEGKSHNPRRGEQTDLCDGYLTTVYAYLAQESLNILWKGDKFWRAHATEALRLTRYWIRLLLSRVHGRVVSS